MEKIPIVAIICVAAISCVGFLVGAGGTAEVKADFDPTSLIKDKVESEFDDVEKFSIEWGSDSATNVYYQGTFKRNGIKYNFYGSCKEFNTGWKVWKFHSFKEDT